MGMVFLTCDNTMVVQCKLFILGKIAWRDDPSPHPQTSPDYVLSSWLHKIIFIDAV